MDIDYNDDLSWLLGLAVRCGPGGWGFIEWRSISINLILLKDDKG